MIYSEMLSSLCNAMILLRDFSARIGNKALSEVKQLFNEDVQLMNSELITSFLSTNHNTHIL